MANIDEIAASLDSQNQAAAQDQKEADRLQQVLDSQKKLQTTIEAAVKSLIAFQASHEPNVSVKNQKLPTSIKTPDVQGVVDALNSLKTTTETTKPDNTELLKALVGLQTAITNLPSQITIPEAPEPLETVTVKNQPDYKPDFDKLTKTVKSLDVKPAVTVNQEKVSLDIKPVVTALDSVLQAVNNIPKPPKVDFSSVVQATASVQQAIAALRFPVPNYVLPFKDGVGKASQATVTDGGKLLSGNGLIPVEFNRISFSNADANGNYQTGIVKKADSTVGTLTLAYDGSSNLTDIQFN